MNNNSQAHHHNNKTGVLVRRTNPPYHFQSEGYIYSQTEQAYLLKRFPKYYKNLTLEISNNKIISRIKRLKQTQHFYGLLTKKHSKYLWLGILNNKLKDLKTLPYTPLYANRRAIIYPHPPLRDLNSSKIKYSSRLTKLTLPCFPDEPIQLSKLERSSVYFANLKLAQRYTKGLFNSLQELDLIVHFGMSQAQLQAINKMLNLKQNFPLLHIIKLAVETNQTSFSLSTILSGAYQNITHLTLNWSFSQTCHSELIDITHFCQNLSYLSLSFPGSQEQSYSSFLASLNRLKKLTTISLRFDKDFSFVLRNLALPSSLKNISFNLARTDLSNLLPTPVDWKTLGNSQGPNPFECNPDYKRFCDEWKHLANLEKLRIRFEIFGNDIMMRYFAGPILKNLPCLTSFKIIENSEESGQIPFKLQALSHFKTCLKELTLKLPVDDSLSQTLMDSLESFINLESLELDVQVYPHNPVFKGICDLLKKNLYSIKIDSVYITEYQHLFTLLKILENVEVPNGKMLLIYVYVQNIEKIQDILDALSNFAQTAKSAKEISFIWILRKVDCKYIEEGNLVPHAFKNIEFVVYGTETKTIYTYQFGNTIKINTKGLYDL